MLQVWSYMASDGAAYYGVMVGFSDFGGTDVTYRFHRFGDDGLPITFSNGGIRLDCVGGYNLKNAQRVGATHKGAPWFRHASA